jgi:hypothetical protein
MHDRILKRIGVALLLAWALTGATSAYAGLGKIAGTVKDAQTGAPLPGANLTIVGTSFGANSDANGNYFILNVPPGTYSMRVTYIGYESKAINNISVSLDVTTPIDVSLTATAVVGEEVVVVAERPLVDKTLTASRSNIGIAELNNTLPTSSLAEIVETTASSSVATVAAAAIRLPHVVDGINISDTYFSGGTGGNGAVVYQSYTATRRSEGDESNVVDVNAQSVSELAVLAGTFNAEYDAATAGIINIATRDGAQKFSGKLFLRSSAGGLDHAGPDTYNDLARYQADRQSLLDRKTKADSAKASLMNFNQASIDATGYGADPTIDGELSLGGPMTSKGNFYFTGRLLNSNGRFPDEFNRELNTSLKLNYNLKNTQKVTANVILNDGGVLGGWKNRAFSSRFKYFPQGNAQNEKQGLVAYLAWTNSLSPKTFYDVRASYTGRTSRFGYSDDDGDGIIEPGENGDFLILQTKEQSEKYLGVGGSGVIGTTRTFFTGDPGNEAYFNVPYSGNQYRFGQPGFYYEELKRNNIQLKADFTSQVTFHHQLKGGLLYRNHTVEDFQQRTQVIKTYDRNFPFEQTSYKLHPKEYAVYVQDRIEYQGIIINAGLRLDGFNTGAENFADFFNVSRLDTLPNGALQRTQLRSASVPTEWFLGPRIGISHPISATAAMHYSWGRFFSPPPFSALFENYGNWSNPSLPVLQDVATEPSKATAYEIGVQWSSCPIFPDATGYYRDISNYSVGGYTIVPATGQGFGPYTYYTNFGYADSRGVELTVEKRPSGWLSASLRFQLHQSRGNAQYFAQPSSFSYAADGAPGIPFDDRYQWSFPANITGGANALESGFDREHRLALTFLLDFPYDIDVTGISTAQSGFWYYLTQTTSDPRGREQDRSPWSYRTDMRLSKGFNFGGSRLGRIFVEGRNIFNQTNTLTWDNYNPNSGRLWEEKQDPTGDLNRATTPDGVPIFDIAREIYFGMDFSF